MHAPRSQQQQQQQKEAVKDGQTDVPVISDVIQVSQNVLFDAFRLEGCKHMRIILENTMYASTAWVTLLCKFVFYDF